LYEITVFETDESFVTTDRNTALYHYRKGDMVFEVHKTITQTSELTQVVTRAIMQWNNNPKFTEEE
jgi:hypothetical protein